jgi:hypothetical protein
VRGEIQFPPLELMSFASDVRRGAAGSLAVLDGVLTVRWGGRSFEFGVELSRDATPKSIEAAVRQAKVVARSAGVHPLLVVPYLSQERLAALEADGVSGLDLCGNGVIAVPGELLVYRTGSPNRFPSEGAIKNVYRKNSSIVARAFLLSSRYDSVRELLAEIRKRRGDVTLATVSKVCSRLDEDLVIERSRDESSREKQLRLLQPEKLLKLLASNYAPPVVSRTFVGKCTIPYEDLLRTLEEWEDRSGNRVVETGTSSSLAYSMMVREPMRSFYCTDLEGVRMSLGDQLKETGRFANVEFLETGDEFVYFDRRRGLVASPIQSYVELLAGDKRERETAEQVQRIILDALEVGKEAR